MALHRVGLDQNRPLTFRRTRIQERAMLVLKPTSPSRHPENGEGATFIKNNDTAFITRPSLSFDGKRREMGRETTEEREKREKKKSPPWFPLAFLGLSPLRASVFSHLLLPSSPPIPSSPHPSPVFSHRPPILTGGGF